MAKTTSPATREHDGHDQAQTVEQALVVEHRMVLVNPRHAVDIGDGGQHLDGGDEDGL